jgi:hypothetical protein
MRLIVYLLPKQDNYLAYKQMFLLIFIKVKRHKKFKSLKLYWLQRISAKHLEAMQIKHGRQNLNT